MKRVRETERDWPLLGAVTRSGHDVDGLHQWQIYLEKGLSFNLQLCEELLHICHPILQFHQHLELWILQHTIRTLVTTDGVSCALTHVQLGGTSRHIRINASGRATKLCMPRFLWLCVEYIAGSSRPAHQVASQNKSYGTECLRYSWQPYKSCKDSGQTCSSTL
jgi:hypothetical protein